MEVWGVLEALRYFKVPTKINIFSDSQYVVNTIENGWVFIWLQDPNNDKKNMDLWREVAKLLTYHTVHVYWVKGHSNYKYNNLADLLATHAAQCLNIPEDDVFAVAIQESG